MKKTLQDQYLLIKEGKGHKGVFLTEAKRQFPNIVRNSATFEEAAASLITKNIITENVVGMTVASGYEPRKKELYETAFEAFLAEAKKKENEDEKVKAEEKKVSKPVEKDLAHNYNTSDEKNPDNMIFGQIMMGYYAEMKDPKNSEKTMEELKDIVFKNLVKDPIYYTKNAQFGIKDLGYTDEATALDTPKEAKGKYKSSGYGDLNENIEKFKSDVKGEFEKKPNKKFTDKELKANIKKKREEELKRRKEAGEPLEEIKLREVIREMIDAELEEAYQMPSVNTANISGGEGGKRFIPTKLPFPANIRKRFGDHMVYNPINGTFYISDILYNNLVKGYANQPAIKKLIMDIPPMVKQILNKPDNYGPIVNLPKEFKVYHPLNAEVEKAKEDKFNKARTKQYWSEGDFLFPNLNILTETYEELDYYMSIIDSNNMSKEDAYNFLEDQGLSSMQMDSIISQSFPSNEGMSLKESVEKDLANINKEAEHEVLQSKIEKIQTLIDKKQSQLSKLDEDEDMKSLTDDKKVKEISKDIKTLEKAKAKLEKLMSKSKGKSTKKEVIDEVEGEELDQETINGITEKYNDIYEKNGVVTDQDIEKIADQYPFNEKSSIIDYLDGYDPGLEFDI
jgi:hypothetical protein